MTDEASAQPFLRQKKSGLYYLEEMWQLITFKTSKAKVETEINKFYGKEQVYLIVDLLGGTPGNVAVNLTQEFPELHVISGLNLPMVINYANQKFIGSDIKIADLLKESKEGIVDVNDFLNSDSDDDDEEDE